MELKNAVAVCLISLFSATLVVLIARALDVQTASRLEPQLTRIADELEAIHAAGGLNVANVEGTGSKVSDDALVVYYFHGNIRCATCRSIESQSYATVLNDFGPQIDEGRLIWKKLNYDEPAGKELAEKFGVHMAVVVLAKMQGKQIVDWKRLDKVWALEGDEVAFADFLRGEISGMLGNSASSPATSGEEPKAETADVEPDELPLPSQAGDLPLP